MKKIDELKAEIEKAEKELEGKKEELRQIESIKSLKIGDYIQCTTLQGEKIVGELIAICINGENIRYKIKTQSMETTLINVPIKKWQPQRGDLCIFWDNEKRDSFVDVFKKQDGCLYSDRQNCRFFNCIPFISEEQFKEHIGYEN